MPRFFLGGRWEGGFGEVKHYGVFMLFLLMVFLMFAWCLPGVFIFGLGLLFYFELFEGIVFPAKLKCLSLVISVFFVCFNLENLKHHDTMVLFLGLSRVQIILTSWMFFF